MFFPIVAELIAHQERLSLHVKGISHAIQEQKDTVQVLPEKLETMVRLACYNSLLFIACNKESWYITCTCIFSMQQCQGNWRNTETSCQE